MSRGNRAGTVVLIALLVSPVGVAAQPRGEAAIRLTKGLFVGDVVKGGRELFRTDPIAYQFATGKFGVPKAGDEVPSEATKAEPGKGPVWAEREANDRGEFPEEAGRGGYAWFGVESGSDRVMVLEAAAHSMVYVGAEPRMGDPYASGIVHLPVMLRKGTTPFLFAIGGRAPFRAVLRAPRADVELDDADLTLPDLVRGEEQDVLFSPLVRNNTPRTVRATIMARVAGRADWADVGALELPPLSISKPALKLAQPVEGVGEDVELSLRVSADGMTDDLVTRLRVRGAAQTRKITFLDPADGSVQYYGVTAPIPGSRSAHPALVLSLHGASVEAISQADAYSPKPDMWIVCPTNRRPFGFDWEDWGRDNALAALADAEQRFQTDPTRVYLTGHSMGGHGSWQLASLLPGRFAAVAPSAGWISFESYAGAPAPDPAKALTPAKAMIRRAAATSDTLAMLHNLSSLGVYIVHGDADDNVPISEARRMHELLSAFHHDLRFHEEPGAGHWWDQGEFGPLPGAACVDFPPVFDFFARHRLPLAGEVREVDFTTVNPAVSASCQWVTVDLQESRLVPSRVRGVLDVVGHRVRLTTTNVASLSIAPVLADEGGLEAEVDGQRVTIESMRAPATLTRVGGGWRVSGAPAPPPPGTFKAGFRGFNFVYATGGTAEENAASYAEARFDAEQWWYRGNGRATLIPDTGAVENLPSCTLYGNRETNRAWASLLGDAPFDVTRRGVRLAGNEVAGAGAVLLALHRAADGRVIGVLAPTDEHGVLTCARLPLFTSGVGVPEVLVVTPEVLRSRDSEPACAAMLANDWGLDPAGIVTPAPGAR